MQLLSDVIKRGMSRSGARSMWKATGLTESDLEKPLVAVCHTWTDVTPCSINQRRLAEKVKQGIRASGGTPFEFNSITVTDGIAMGTEGMKSSLISREIVADSFELAVRSHLLDAIVCICDCDKTTPGTVVGRHRVPARRPRPRGLRDQALRQRERGATRWGLVMGGTISESMEKAR